MSNTTWRAHVLASAIAISLVATAADEVAAQSRNVPTFAVEKNWPKVPPQWKLGDVSSIATDAEGNAWVLHRPRTLEGADLAKAAPPVLEFDPAGNFIKDLGWAGSRLRMGRARARHSHRL